MELEQRIQNTLVERMDLDEESLAGFTWDTLLFRTDDGRPSLGLDSIDALELVTAIYDVWGVDVPTEDMKKLYSVNAIAEYIRNAQK